MPHDRAAVHLQGVLSAIWNIGEIMGDVPPATALTDLRSRSALLWELFVVGEACARVRRDAPEVTGELTDFDSIVAFRNVLAHGYDRIRDSIIAAVVTEKLPLLRQEVTALLDRMDREGNPRG